MQTHFSHINQSKAVFDDIYALDDPRAYFSVLGDLDYMIPDVAEPVVRQILAAKVSETGVKPTVLDVGCSYGINAAVHRFPLTFGGLRHRYARREMRAIGSETLVRLDRNFYAAWPDVGLARFIGLDISAPAISYATGVGLLEQGIVADLETEALSADSADLIRSADVIMSTGCIGYVTEKTFSKILDATEKRPWIISFVLRMFPFDSLAATFEKRGLVTERLTGATFIQRRFRDAEEFESCLASLAALGVDATGLESEGLFHADLMLSRPEADARAAPLKHIVTVASGRGRPIGPRYVHIEGDDGLQVALEP
ncbi:SAM-dependent methyltransferase [Bradyrhizobium elkanii]|uniref:class I SAM-dependent methyltransferase n=1 Tax=Bradyrhizobium elkanii TaxID=29448 RepID=UPI00209E70A3|nr:class I SAM-dependent methyltransferase [Bradyrhizobium elkanii]MCP1966983.1 SAM-dependent methyltransferase [Bradyrhizobium elkanii]MCS3523152.1 SAM-dependent methyltransferase [Bradyrhizobium elkanii]MCS4070805.1 SAM-dependent methyltransferase [Bradyrhizobium elkanii]MCS4077437.1 SAM-dependent methyltransferase [Bradyrhizobium elkanii]MCS4111511.1 SAM-dependent methyltransferase [Bradyrhizobium elkanii]